MKNTISYREKKGDRMKHLDLAKKLAVLGMIYNAGLISEEEYGITKNRIMMDYNIVSFLNN